jgi:hypothetical protein
MVTEDNISAATAMPIPVFIFDHMPCYPCRYPATGRFRTLEAVQSAASAFRIVGEHGNARNGREAQTVAFIPSVMSRCMLEQSNIKRLTHRFKQKPRLRYADQLKFEYCSGIVLNRTLNDLLLGVLTMWKSIGIFFCQPKGMSGTIRYSGTSTISLSRFVVP